jgi:glycerophosphoryl diester phosphodiesterase
VSPRVAAHRGGAGLRPENSLAAFGHALALGVPLLELDVHLTADGGVAVVHDRTLERTTDGRGRVGERTRSELGRLRLRAGDGTLTDEPVPALEDVLALVRGTNVELLVEVKTPEPAPRWTRRGGRVEPLAVPCYPGLEDRVVAALDAAGVAARLMAFAPEVVGRLRARAPGRRAVLLIDRPDLEAAQAPPAECAAWARSLGATDLGLHHALVDAAVVAAARAAGLGLGAWTVDDPAEMRRLAGLGVDTITTDRPDVALHVLGVAA